jgi:hypothetical protein
MARQKPLDPGSELLCHTCVYGPGGHGELECEGIAPIMSRGMTNVVVCNQYTDILTAETKPERPRRGETDD